MIPVTTVRLGEEEERLVLEVLRSGQLAQGAYVEQFETDFARLHGVRHGIAVNNGTTALVAALQALRLQPGDEVITSPFTFVATLNAILEAGAIARFADIGPDFNVDSDSMAALVNERTKVLLPVHLYGYMADMDAVMALAANHGLHVVEDAAQAVGARCGDQAAGSFGLGCFSLYATKNVTTGEGGMITTDDDVIADRLRVLRNQGMRRRYEYVTAGHNYRMTNIQAAIGIPQLARYQAVIVARQGNAAVLREGLADVPGLELPQVPAAGRTHVYHQFTIRITPKAPVSRDQFVEELTRLGIGCGVYYPAVVHSYDCYRDLSGVVPDVVPNAVAAAAEAVSLPVHQYLSEADLLEIIAGVREVLG